MTNNATLPVLKQEYYKNIRERTGQRGKELALSHKIPMYPTSIRNAPEEPIKSTGLRALKTASSNGKLGKGTNIIEKGPKTFREKPLYALTLTERITCPQTCNHWETCFGNNMPFAHRHLPGPELEDAIRADVATLDSRHADGFVVRLHILGDFFSTGYVDLWKEMLETYPKLCIFGYTHRLHGSPIGDAVAEMVQEFPDRCSILRSDKVDPEDPLPGAYSVMKGEAPQEDVLICPEQTGKTESCLTCGLCFHGKFEVQFLQH